MTWTATGNGRITRAQCGAWDAPMASNTIAAMYGGPGPHPHRRGQVATMPSPPAPPGTVTVPIGVSEPLPAIRNSSTVPFPPAWT
jgi:hypothetical protein